MSVAPPRCDAPLARAPPACRRRGGAHERRRARRRASGCASASSASAEAIVEPMGASVSCVAGEGNGAPLLYLPGMDGIGYTFSAQADLLATRGYEVWCLKLPASDRRPLDALAEALAPLVARVAERHGTGVTLVAESFGAPTALRLAGSAHTGSAVSRLVLCNPATNLSESNMLVGTASAAGLFQLLPLVPTELISWARGTVWPLMLEEGRVDPKVVSGGADVVPADTVTFRLSQLAADSGRLSDSTLRRVHQKVLVISSAKDRVLDSVAEGRRLQALLRDATTVVLPDSGHVALLERGIDLPALMADNGVDVPAAPVHARRGTEDGNARAKGGDGAGRSNAVAAFDDAGRERGGSTRARRGNRPSSRIPPAPTDDDYKMLATLMTPWKAATAPLVLGAENLPSPGQRDGRAVLFVGNHGRMGLYDLPLLLLELHELGFSARGLAHRSHYASGNPMGPIFERFGAVQVTPMSVFELLTRGENVLLFPGGAQEVLKRDGQQNKVIWKSEVDFVRLAAKTDALIVPFASVGADDAFKWHTDTDELLALPVVGDAIRESVKMVDSSLQPEDTVYPVTQLGNTGLPSPVPLPSSVERIYFKFEAPIDLRGIDVSKGSGASQGAYDEVRSTVQRALDDLVVYRDQEDPERELSTRMLSSLPFFNNP